MGRARGPPRTRMRSRTPADDPRLHSAYDEASNLRVVRLGGTVEVEWITEVAVHDPTIRFLPDCFTLLDLRLARPRGGPGDIARLAARMSGKGEPRAFKRYAWLFDRTDAVGMAMLYQADTGAREKLNWFTDLDEALGHLGVTREDFERVESELQPVSPDRDSPTED